MKKSLYIDCSLTSVKNSASGISRVVSNVIKSAKLLEKSLQIQTKPVVLHKGKMYEISVNSIFKKPISINKFSSKKRTLLELLREILAGILPYRFIYLIRKILIRNELPVFLNEIIPEKGDILLLIDSSWGMDIWKSVERLQAVGVIIVSVIYDLIPISHPHFVSKWFTKIFRHWINNMFEYTDGFIGISETVKDDIHTFYKKSNNKRNAVHFDSFRLGSDFKKNSRNEKNIHSDIREIFKKNRSTYLVVSSVEPRKNHKYLIDVFDILWEKGLDIQLCIVGEILRKTDRMYKRILSHKQYSCRLFMFNNMDDENLLYCYRNSKALLYPSFVEGFGLPIVEGLFNSLPVLASDIPIHREVGQDSIAYFNPYDPMDLAGQLEDVENGKKMLHYKKHNKNINISWKESTKQLFTKVLKIKSSISN